MANCYLRVPNYVAAYFRNRDVSKKIPVGGVLNFDSSTKLSNVFVNMIHSNNSESIVPMGSFCERQWRRMLRGNTIYTINSERPPEGKTIPLSRHEWLSDKEVSVLAGISKKPRNDEGEYLCLKLPSEVYINNKPYKVNGQWQLMNGGEKRMILLMTEEFWRAAFLYIRSYRKWCSEKKMKTSYIESLQQFMRYIGINSEENYATTNKMISNYYYWKKRHQFDEDDFIEHANDSSTDRY